MGCQPVDRTHLLLEAVEMWVWQDNIEAESSRENKRHLMKHRLQGLEISSVKYFHAPSDRVTHVFVQLLAPAPSSARVVL